MRGPLALNTSLQVTGPVSPPVTRPLPVQEPARRVRKAASAGPAKAGATEVASRTADEAARMNERIWRVFHRMGLSGPRPQMWQGDGWFTVKASYSSGSVVKS